MGEDNTGTYKVNLQDYPYSVSSDYHTYCFIEMEPKDFEKCLDVGIWFDGKMHKMPTEDFKKAISDYYYANEWRWNK